MVGLRIEIPQGATVGYFYLDLCFPQNHFLHYSTDVGLIEVDITDEGSVLLTSSIKFSYLACFTNHLHGDRKLVC